MILLFFNLVGPILLLSAEKRTERSNVYGLNIIFHFSFQINIADNECASGHGCAHDCARINSTNICSCRAGYTLANNGLDCNGGYLFTAFK